MSLLRVSKQTPIQLQLRRDLVRSVKRGHSWIYTDALRALPKTQRGVSAILLDNRGGREIGRGYYDPQGKIALRVCTTQRGETLTDFWAAKRMRRALSLRQALFDDDTTGYRLFNGEGDGLPGLVCDRYADAAVISLDGEAARKFWDAPGIARWLSDTLGLRLVYERLRGHHTSSGRLLYGPTPDTPIHFLEHGIRFTADLVRGQKTGFFLDQRDNRLRVQKYISGRQVLNVFGYTGGFSIYAGIGGAAHVTTVDTAQPALDTAAIHWTMNDLPIECHNMVCVDAFDFLSEAKREKNLWDVVILDPPSFAPSK
ncbi:class I SAM-dependent rRNA methyltransferase, partial [Chloroflexota bacterium]